MLSGQAVGDELMRRLVVFGRTLRAAGLPVDAPRLQNALRALAVVDPASAEETYWALRCTLVSRQAHIDRFDLAFGGLWAGSDREPQDLSATRGGGACDGNSEAVLDRIVDTGETGAGHELETAEIGKAASVLERLQELDFGAFGERELLEARRLIERLATSLPRRQALRLTAASRGTQLDFRRTLRSALRTEGHPMVRAWREKAQAPRRTTFLLDISGSMAPYARPMIMFAQAAVQAGRLIEVFTFGTRLSRLTEDLADWDLDRGLATATRIAPDWAGGTRIGDSLRAFNDEWGRRGMARGAAVVIVSDGWERDNPRAVGDEMARLARSAHTIIWVNPLAGDADYEPLAGGMAAALPSVDVFLPGHNLRALHDLARALETLPSQRRRTRASNQRFLEAP
jgi:uncharacterized protein with von Willebrand factor type A (vWA) domain